MTYPFFSRILRLLGPAFVAAIAYVDPGNFAANFSAGSQYGYALLWVLIAANGMGAIAQYVSAKIGIVTGKSLPQLIAERTSRPVRVMYWFQAEVVAIATDIAEIVGGALAFSLLFNLPLIWGGVMTGILSMMLLFVYSHHGQRYFERLILALLLLIPVGFFVGLAQHPPSFSGIFGGLLPQLPDHQAILLASAMIGATVMPHVIYLHSALARDRHGKVMRAEISHYLRATRVDVGVAMCVAGTVNVAMLLLAAATLHGQPVETFDALFHLLGQELGSMVAVLFAVGLLIAGLASTSVGSQAGSIIMQDFTRINAPLWLRRLVTMLPAFVLLLLNVNPMTQLVLSQVVLSIGIPFALIPLLVISSDHRVMGQWASGLLLRILLGLVVVLVVALNLFLLIMPR